MRASMKPETVKKYKPYPVVDLPDRTWPGKTITEAPRWCSVDLRDGNQALVQPMNLEQKLELFTLLVDVGFKEIEVGFPWHPMLNLPFARTLIDDDLIPDDVTIQVLTPARDNLLRRALRLLRGQKMLLCTSIILHLRCSVVQCFR